MLLSSQKDKVIDGLNLFVAKIKDPDKANKVPDHSIADQIFKSKQLPKRQILELTINPY